MKRPSNGCRDLTKTHLDQQLQLTLKFNEVTCGGKDGFKAI